MGADSCFEKNRAALARVNPDLAERLAAVEPADVMWSETRSGAWTASLEAEGRRLSLASRYDPEKEALRLVGEIDYDQTACVVLLGFGLGYHVQQVVKEMGNTGVVVAYEPDASLLRAVFEKLDCREILSSKNFILVDDAMSRAELTGRLEKVSYRLTQGTQLIEHPPSRQRHREAFRTFSTSIKEVLAYCRTTIATALVNSSRTCSNLACNLDHYAAGETTEPLLNAAKGYPAVCVSAGPSLVKNVHLLQDPAVRRNVIVITAQTTLKPLLERGVRPDFVTALDYARISKRFYENLPDLSDVTLVAEPKAHPTILDSFPGPIRVCRSEFNDGLIEEMKRPITPVPSGATVAHLSFYLAQHLGCDPIMFIGQDLGFSKGLYYAPGMPVHQVWSGELNQFNTVEMMEWRRIARLGGHLQRKEDIDGQPIFSDEQMLTYHKQFERDFINAPQTVIDATEGGLPKQGTTTMPFREALERHATAPVPELPIPSRRLDLERLTRLRKLLAQRLSDVRQLRRSSRQSMPILRQMKKHQRNQPKMKKLFSRLNRHQRYVENELKQAFATVNALNTLGTYRRSRTDRAIHRMAEDSFEKQAQQLDRDLENLQWLSEACDEALEILREAYDRIEASEQREANQASDTPEPAAKTQAAVAASAG
jgi:hypothetical protein